GATAGVRGGGRTGPVGGRSTVVLPAPSGPPTTRPSPPRTSRSSGRSRVLPPAAHESPRAASRGAGGVTAGGTAVGESAAGFTVVLPGRPRRPAPPAPLASRRRAAAGAGPAPGRSRQR